MVLDGGFCMTPQKARTRKAHFKLNTDHCETARSWIIVDERTIRIHNQVTGFDSTGRIELTRKEFNKFIAWYLHDQKEYKKASTPS